MRKLSLARIARGTAAIAALSGAAPHIAGAQTTHPASHAAAPATEQLEALASLTLAISQARDSTQKLLAQSRSATPLMQQQLRDQLSSQIAAILGRAGMSEAEYRRQTYVVSTDSAARAVYDRAIARLTGAPIPGQLAAAPTAAVALPAGPVGVHLGHVLNAFADTPGGQGLLPTAMAEALVAAQHAQLAARDTGDLAGMKRHAAHVVHAVDPSVVTTGPGLGYGVKRAALGIATHVDLAAKADGASPGAVMHAGHAAVSARNTLPRVDRIVALGKQIQAATSTGEAISLVSQLVALTTELTAGRDADADGKVTWKDGEGGLRQCDEHVRLMVGAM